MGDSEANRGGEIFQRLFHMSLDMLCIAGLDGFFKRVNPAMIKTLGWTEEELLSRPWIEFVHPEDRQLTEAARGHLVKGKEIFHFENRYRGKDGSWYWFSWTSMPVLEQELIFAVARDITKQKQMEEELQRYRLDLEKQVKERTAVLAGINRIFREALFCVTEEQLGRFCLATAQKLTGSKFGFICEVDQAGSFKTIAINIPGWSACELPQTETSHLLKDLEVGGIPGRVIKTGETLICNDPASHPDWTEPSKGHPAMTSFLGVPLKFEGQTFGMVGLANRPAGYDKQNQEDVETLAVAMVEALMRKRAEWKLTQLRQHHELILSSASEGILGVDLKGDMTFVNPAAAQMLGYEEEELLGRSSHAVWHHTKPDGSPFPLEECPILETLREGISLSFEDDFFWRKDGTGFPVRCSRNPIIQNEQIFGVVVTFRDITARKQAEEDRQQTMSRLQQVMGEIVQAMALTVEIRDPYTAGHQRRVTRMAQAIAREMGLSQEQHDAVWVAGTLHDLGKIYVPEGILSRPGRLSDIEFAMIKTHCQKGYEILQPIQFPWPVAQIVRQHHERLDGSGYPDGLQGEEILLEAKILAVADVVEAMASHRPYRPALGIDAALEEISRNRGTLFDLRVVDACLKVFEKKSFNLE